MVERSAVLSVEERLCCNVGQLQFTYEGRCLVVKHPMLSTGGWRWVGRRVGG
jgi:hypothetical protein